MPTNLAIDPELLDEAHRIGGHRTKKATVTEALQEYILRRRASREQPRAGVCMSRRLKHQDAKTPSHRKDGEAASRVL